MKSKMRHLAWKIYDSRRSLIDFARRKFRKIKRSFKHEEFKNSHTFAITCVKRNIYTNLAIKNINSLHYINPTHKFIIYCDDECYKVLKKNKKYIDYLKQVTFKNIYDIGEKPWQQYKIETIIDASKKGYISVDADEIWHGDLQIDKNKMTFLVTSAKFADNPSEALLMKKLYNEKGWINFNHYNTGLLSIPPHFMTSKLANDIQNLFTKLFENKLDFIPNKDETLRISEEIAINLAIQSNYTEDQITTLKNEDGPKNTYVIQSLYHGCKNKILD